MDESQSIILLTFDCNWSISYGLKLKTSILYYRFELTVCLHIYVKYKIIEIEFLIRIKRNSLLINN